jgi:imidazoleglycerol phosphate dehydratase HisB
VVVHFVEISGIVDHHCLEANVHVVDIGGIVDHHSLEAIVHVVATMVNNSTNINNMNNRL